MVPSKTGKFSLKLLAGAVAGLVILGACATETPYQAALDSNNGYSEQQIENDRYTVAFSGNSLTDRKTVESYLLYRAAELTTQSGYDHFLIVDRDTESNRRVIPIGFGYSPAISYRYFGGFAGDRFSRRGFSRRGFSSRSGFAGRHYLGSEFREVVRYEASAEIIMGKGPTPDEATYFDASEVISNLGPTLVTPEL